MADSILNSIKKPLGLDPEYTAFDTDVIMHINSVFFSLSQLGIGPAGGFSIDDNVATWDEYLGIELTNLHAVKTYMYLRVRLLFDPPATSFAIAAMEKQITEFEWRLNAHREGVVYPWIDRSSEYSDTME